MLSKRLFKFLLLLFCQRVSKPRLGLLLGFTRLGLVVKNPPDNAGDLRDAGSIPGWQDSPGGGHSNPLWHPCLENPVDRGAWQATVHQITKSQRQLKRLSTHARRRKVLNTNVFLNAATPSSLYTAQNPAVFYISQSLILILWNQLTYSQEDIAITNNQKKNPHPD